MSRHMHIILVLVLLEMGTVPAASFAAEATPFQLDASIGYGSGPNDFDAGFGFNFGGGYTLSSIDRNLQARAEIGYYNFGRDVLGNSLDFTRIPFDIGARYYIPVAERLKLFGQAALEMSFDDIETFNVFGVFGNSRRPK